MLPVVAVALRAVAPVVVKEVVGQVVTLARKHMTQENIDAAIAKGRELQDKYDLSLLPTSVLARAARLLSTSEKPKDTDTESMAMK